MRRASVCALLALLFLVEPAHASQSQLRVIVPRASIRSGPGPNYREVYRAERGEVFPVDDRSTVGYWLRVVLPDGTYGWLMGDQTLPLAVDLDGKGGPSVWERIKGAIFAPSPILRSTVGFTFSGGALGGDGMFIFRPSVVIGDYFALEGHAGEAVGQDGSLVVYGLSGDIFIWPEGPLIPFFSLGGGGASSFPKLNGVAQASSTEFALDAGGGAMIVLRKRFTLRFDFRNYTLFTPNSTSNRQEYSGGLAVYF
jgi:hypothetical protein